MENQNKRRKHPKRYEKEKRIYYLINTIQKITLNLPFLISVFIFPSENLHLRWLWIWEERQALVVLMMMAWPILLVLEGIPGNPNVIFWLFSPTSILIYVLILRLRCSFYWKTSYVFFCIWNDISMILSIMWLIFTLIFKVILLNFGRRL